MASDYCNCDYDDFEPPEFSIITHPIARRQHKCDECTGIIAPGEKYRRLSGKWDGDMATFYECIRCSELRQWAEISMPCFCAYAIGTLHERVAAMVADVAPAVDGFIVEYEQRMAAIDAARPHAEMSA